MKNYAEIFNKNGIDSKESKKAIRRLNYVIFFRKIVTTMMLLSWVLLIYMLFTGTNNEKAAVFVAVGSFSLFICGSLYIFYFAARNHYLAQLEEILNNK